MSIQITDNQRIKLSDGTKIGEILYTENTLKQIDIYPPYQGEGYGTKIIQELAQKFQTQGYSEMYIACVTNSKLDHIAEHKLNGEQIDNSSVPIFPDPILEPDKPNYELSLPL